MIVGVLAAAGRGTRYGGDKRLAALPDGTPVAVAAARALLDGGLDAVVAVVRPDDGAVTEALAAAGAVPVAGTRAARGLGASIAAGVAARPDAGGWLVALADMPWIAPATVAAVAARLRAGAPLVRPVRDGVPGHPVGFAAAFGPRLRALDGDTGGRPILRAEAGRVVPVPVTDPGIHADVDRPDDLPDGA